MCSLTIKTLTPMLYANSERATALDRQTKVTAKEHAKLALVDSKTTTNTAN